MDGVFFDRYSGNTQVDNLVQTASVILTFDPSFSPKNETENILIYCAHYPQAGNQANAKIVGNGNFFNIKNKVGLFGSSTNVTVSCFGGYDLGKNDDIAFKIIFDKTVQAITSSTFFYGAANTSDFFRQEYFHLTSETSFSTSGIFEPNNKDVCVDICVVWPGSTINSSNCSFDRSNGDTKMSIDNYCSGGKRDAPNSFTISNKDKPTLTNISRGEKLVIQSVVYSQQYIDANNSSANEFRIEKYKYMKAIADNDEETENKKKKEESETAAREIADIQAQVEAEALRQAQETLVRQQQEQIAAVIRAQEEQRQYVVGKQSLLQKLRGR